MRITPRDEDDEKNLPAEVLQEIMSKMDEYVGEKMPGGKPKEEACEMPEMPGGNGGERDHDLFDNLNLSGRGSVDLSGLDPRMAELIKKKIGQR